MEPFVRITRYPYEEPYNVHLVVGASNGHQYGESEIYSGRQALLELARSLRGFPSPDADSVVWELGSERPEDRFAFYYRLRVFKVAPTGQCAVEFRFNNNREPPHREVAEFALLALPADLDRLASLLEAFSRFEHKVLEWRVTDGELHDDV